MAPNIGADLSPTLNLLVRDLPGWLVFILTFAAPLLSRKLRQDQGSLLAAWTTIFVHQVAAVTNCYLFVVPGAEQDAASFHREAALSSRGEVGIFNVVHLPYGQALTFVYRILGPSHFLGCEISVLAYAVSLIPFIELMEWLNTTQYRPYLIVLAGLLPSAVLYESLTLRESHQALALITLVWTLSLIQTNPRDALPYIGLLVSTVILSTLHNGLAVCAVLMAAGGLLISLYQHNRGTAIVCGILTGFLFLPGSPLLTRLIKLSPAAESLMSGKLGDYAMTYREGISASRANYGAKIDARSLPGLIVTAPPVLVLYMFAPFPWQVTGLRDLYALVESFLRMALVAGAALSIIRAEPKIRSRLIFVSLFFVVIETMWASGSSNWGQAIRHRVIAWTLLILTGAQPILKVLIGKRIDIADPATH